ncbi:hypothetical protein [Runella slithyformis]|uniref:Uncharacterized protein n=1 Tax=Runella slithyformis (strain ATCC 29530 / DSM 19594 / LMG 11500 / NCIMB 11436 / LSU 4) TaxID=761193 RepID=A0A7U3ZKN4_RUNSL|nr:hypothetical protein [Runella slithyformis]AEI48907.1 hypothetical protein Runsl_2503 [Runella slithyformis DSM 19594]
MKLLWYILGITGLGLTIIPAIMVFNGALTSEVNKNYMTAGMFLWFVAATKLIKR